MIAITVRKVVKLFSLWFQYLKPTRTGVFYFSVTSSVTPKAWCIETPFSYVSFLLYYTNNRVLILVSVVFDSFVTLILPSLRVSRQRRDVSRSLKRYSTFQFFYNPSLRDLPRCLSGYRNHYNKAKKTLNSFTNLYV